MLANRFFTIATHDVFDFQSVKACQSEPVEDSRREAFARYASTDEQNRYIDNRFSENLVTELTGLKDEPLLSFMDKYRPTIEVIKKTTDYDIRVYIKACIIKFRSDTLHQTK
jgi:hypothetical protein